MLARQFSVLLADGEPRSRATLAHVLEREQFVVQPTVDVAGALTLARVGELDLVLVNLPEEEGRRLIRELRLTAATAQVPILVIGEAGARRAALEAGASEFLAKPTYLRDVLTMVRLLPLGRGYPPQTWVGDVADFSGLLRLVRALSVSRRTGVMSLSRGFRRGELRFFEGELTSAQLGRLYGLAAFHQLLLWGEGRFELRRELVVRRGQIPLSAEELVENADRFLRDFDRLAKDLLATSVWEQDLRRVSGWVGRIPSEVAPVLRLFDGVRTIADVVEDSPYRIVETIRVAARLAELGAITRLAEPRPRIEPGSSSIDNWLLGTTPPLGIPSLGASFGAEPGPGEGAPARLAEAQPAPSAVDWGRLPAGLPAGDSPFASVVPSQVTSGEIVVATPMGLAGELAVPGGQPLGPGPSAELHPARTAAIEPKVAVLAEPAAAAVTAAEGAPAAMAAMEPTPAAVPAPAALAVASALEAPPATAAAAAAAPEAGPAVGAAAAAAPEAGPAAEAAPAPTAAPAPAPATVGEPVRAAAAPTGVAQPGTPVGQASPPDPGAASFNDMEEGFFKAERKFEAEKAQPIDTFSDLEDVPVSPSAPRFWRRLFGGHAEAPKATEGRDGAASSDASGKPGEK